MPRDPIVDPYKELHPIPCKDCIYIRITLNYGFNLRNHKHMISVQKGFLVTIIEEMRGFSPETIKRMEKSNDTDKPVWQLTDFYLDRRTCMTIGKFIASRAITRIPPGWCPRSPGNSRNLYCVCAEENKPSMIQARSEFFCNSEYIRGHHESGFPRTFQPPRDLLDYELDS